MAPEKPAPPPENQKRTNDSPARATGAIAKSSPAVTQNTAITASSGQANTASSLKACFFRNSITAFPCTHHNALCRAFSSTAEPHSFRWWGTTLTPIVLCIRTNQQDGTPENDNRTDQTTVTPEAILKTQLESLRFIGAPRGGLTPQGGSIAYAGSIKERFPHDLPLNLTSRLNHWS